MVEIYFSSDIEASGPIPGPYSMWSLGVSPRDHFGKRLDKTFYMKLTDLPGSTIHPDTQNFWDRNPKALIEARSNQIDAEEVMKTFSEWIKSFNCKPVFVAYPAGFDWMFVYWYLIYFTGNSPFGLSALDMKSYAMAKLGTEFRPTTKKNFPESWKSKKQHDHTALADADEQGDIWAKMHQSKIIN